MTKRNICPVCEIRPVAAAFKPFCSKRCADVDLSRWLKGAYAIPGSAENQVSDDVSPEDRGTR